MSFTNVVGGVGPPTFFKIDDNFVINPYFDQNTTGWSVSGGTLVRTSQSDAYGEFMGEFQHATGIPYTSVQKDLGVAATNKKFLASFRAKSDVQRDVLIEISDSAGLIVVSKTFAIGIEPKKYLIKGDNIGLTLNQFIELRIHGTDVSGIGFINFDHVYFTEVLDTIILPLPATLGGQTDKLIFEKIVRGRNELWSGAVQEFGKKWRPNYLGRWDHLEITEEMARQKISDAGKIFIQPHDDVDFGFLGIWDGDIERQYSLNRYIGHKGTIPIKGIEFLHEFPFDLAITAEILGVVTIDV